MVKTKFELITALQRKVRSLLPKDVDYDNIRVEYNGKTLNWNQILYRICECVLKKIDTFPWMIDHFHLRYFKGRYKDLWKKVIPMKDGSFISWKDLSSKLDEFFKPHIENLQVWKNEYKRLSTEAKNKYQEKYEG